MGPLVLKNKEIDLYLSTVDNFYRTAPGTPIIDLPLETLEGDTTFLSKQLLPGCYTLLHCWAGWCKPCLDEMPNLIKAYKIYHERGLNMVGIFLWDKPSTSSSGHNSTSPPPVHPSLTASIASPRLC